MDDVKSIEQLKQSMYQNYQFKNTTELKKQGGGGNEDGMFTALPEILKGSLSEYIIRVHESHHHILYTSNKSTWANWSFPEIIVHGRSLAHMYYSETSAMMYEWSFIQGVPEKIKQDELLKIKKLLDHELLEEDIYQLLSVVLSDKSKRAGDYILNQSTENPKRGYSLSSLRDLEVRSLTHPSTIKMTKYFVYSHFPIDSKLWQGLTLEDVAKQYSENRN